MLFPEIDKPLGKSAFGVRVQTGGLVNAITCPSGPSSLRVIARWSTLDRATLSKFKKAGRNIQTSIKVRNNSQKQKTIGS